VTTRRQIALTLGAVAIVSPLASFAQPRSVTVSRIGYLGAGSASNVRYAAFRKGLRELGWIEGQNIVIESRFAEGRFDRLPQFASELVRDKVAIIVAVPTASAVAAKNATTTIPIVMIDAGDPVGLGLVASLTRPGGNITGLAFGVGMETVGKQLEALREIVPALRRVATLSNAANPSHAIAMRNVKGVAESLGVQLLPLELRSPTELEDLFGVMARERVQALLVMPDSLFILHRTRLAELAFARRLPVAYGNPEIVEAGGLMSYGPSITENFVRAATYVDNILKGAKPGDLPVGQPTIIELIINLKTAKALGLKVPPAILQRADRVIE
jgi:putative ABC transport system substrate-binding protein